MAIYFYLLRYSAVFGFDMYTDIFGKITFILGLAMCLFIKLKTVWGCFFHILSDSISGHCCCDVCSLALCSVQEWGKDNTACPLKMNWCSVTTAWTPYRRWTERNRIQPSLYTHMEGGGTHRNDWKHREKYVQVETPSMMVYAALWIPVGVWNV